MIPPVGRTSVLSSELQPYRLIAQSLAILIIAVGTFHFMDWLIGDLAQQGLSQITMKTNAALNFIFLGVGILCVMPLRENNVWLMTARVCGAVALSLGVLTFIENMSGLDFGIDQVFAREPLGALGVDHPNRMGTPASLAFAFSGLAVVSFSVPKRSAVMPQVLGLLVICIGFFSLMGYSYGVKPMFGLAKLTAIAFPTALAIVALGLALILVRPGEGIAAVFTTTPTGRDMLGSFLIPFIVLAFLTGYLKLLGERFGFYDPATGTGLRTLVFIIFFTLMLYRNTKELNKRVNDQRSAQKALEHKEAELREAQRIAHVGHWFFDAKTGEVSASEEVFLIQGLDPSQPYPAFCEENRALFTLTQDSWEKVTAAVQETLQTGNGYELDLESRHRDGQHIWFTARAEAVRDADGRISGLRGTVQDITARKQAEESLRRSAQRLSLAQRAGRIGIFDWELKTNEVFWTPELEEMFGVTQSESQRRYDMWARCVHPEDLVRLEAFFAEWIQSDRQEAQWEYRYFHHGEEGWISARGHVFRDAAGRAQRVLGTNIDITQRKKTEEALKESEARFRGFIDQAPFSVQVFSPAGTTVHVNHAWEKLWGIRLEQLENYNIFEDPQLKARGLIPYIHRAFRGEVVEVPPIQYNLGKSLKGIMDEKDLCCWVSAVAYPLQDQNGRVREVILVHQDITSRKNAEEALRKSEERYRALFGALDEGFCVIEMMFDDQHRPVDYRFLEVNETFEKLTGLIRPVGKTMRELSFNLDAHWFEIYGKVAVTGDSVRFENYAKSLERWFDVFAFRFTAADHNQVALLFKDITHRKESEGKLKRTNEDLMNITANLEKRVQERTLQLENLTVQLRQLAVELTEVEQSERKRLAQVLHDHLQQLLVAAKMRVELLERRTPGIDKKSINDLRSYLEQAVQSSRSLTAELRPPVLYESGLQAALQFLSRKMEEQYKLKVMLETAPNAEPASDFIKAIIYASVQELLFNTAKYANVTRCTLTLSRAANRNIIVRLHDEGVGFNPETIGRNTTGGFGLFSIRERVKALEGEFTVTSSPGEGSTFIISLPDRTDVSDLGSEPLRHEELKKRRSHKHTGTLKILLADDHRIVRQSLASLLTAQPYVKEVIEAEDGEDVISKFKRTNPDLVIMDLNMPKRNGIEATRILHELDPTVKIIGLSVQTEQETAHTMIKAGAVAYFNKAADTDSLMETIKCLAD